MDNVIPKIGGVNSIKILKSNPRSLHIPVILCSGDEDILNLATEAGADFYLSKPFEIKKIEKLMGEAYELYLSRNLGFLGESAQDKA